MLYRLKCASNETAFVNRPALNVFLQAVDQADIMDAMLVVKHCMPVNTVIIITIIKLVLLLKATWRQCTQIRRLSDKVSYSRHINPPSP